jgi:serine/threonine-protein kinase
MERVGKYELIQKIASGGMAEVFLAKTAGPLGFEKTLVVKRILPHLVTDPEFVEMFLSEAKLAAHLNHHNVVQIFDFGEADGAYFIAMEYIDGTNLRELARRAEELKRPIPFPICAKIAALACEGLAYAHDLTDPSTGEPLNVVHRDISPDNIMVTRTGGVKVVDFGIAKAASQIHQTGRGIVTGKLSYMSPEQIAQKTLDRRTDVYAMGVVLYTVLTGAKPFTAESNVSLMHAILLESPVKPRARRPEIPEALEQIIERAMERDLLKRYQNCLEVQVDLEQYLRTCDVPAGSPEIAAFVTEIAPSLPTNRPPGAKTPHPFDSRQAISAPVSAGSPAEADGLEPTVPAKSQNPGRTGDKAAPAPEPPKKPARRMPPLVWAIAGAAGGVLALSTSGYLLARPGRDRPDTEVSPATAPDASSQASHEDSGALVRQPTSLSGATVFFRSIPAGNLRVNGKVVGRTPMQVVDLPAGKVVVQVFGDDFSREETFDLQPGDNGTKQLTVRRATIQFRVQPYAIVTLDGQELGQTPLPAIKVYEGEHQARFWNPSLHKTIIRKIQIQAGENKIYPLTIE